MKYSRISNDEAERLKHRDRNRLIAMSVLTVLVAGAYLFTVTRAKDEDAERSGDIAQLEEVSTLADVVVPEFTRPELLERIADSTDSDRELLEGEALKAVFDYARLLTGQALQALDIREVNAERHDELMRAPSEHRLAALRGRGQVVNAYQRPRADGARKNWAGTLKTLDGRHVHFLVATAPMQPSGERGIKVGDYLRLDGIFYSLFSTPLVLGGETTQAVGPLIVSARIDPSSAPMTEEVARLAPALEGVKDDSVGAAHDPDSFDDALWQLMGRAKLLGDTVDWDTVPELDTAILNEIHADGTAFRGKPFRVPVSINLDTFSRRANDNPLRLDRSTVGWIGNNNWIGAVKTIKWHGPFTRQDMVREEYTDQHRYVTAKGYFLRNHVFTGEKGQPARSPIFVMHSVEVFTPEEDKAVALFTWGILGLTILLTIVIGLLLYADKRKSAELYENMVRRKRARRDRAEPTAAA